LTSRDVCCSRPPVPVSARECPLVRKCTRLVPARLRRCVWADNKKAYLQGFSLSPLMDSNRRPPPYHGGFALREREGGTALAVAFFLQLRRFVCLAHPSLEEP
jgi:hypothetical protein